MKYKVIDREFTKQIFMEDNPEIKYIEFNSIGDAQHYIKTGQIRASSLIEVFTDGDCNNETAGIGVFFGKNDQHNVSRKISGKQTNHRAELLAIIEVFSILKKEITPRKGVLDKVVIIYTDSQYSINALTKCSVNWEKNDWKKKNKKKISNLEIIKEGYYLLKEYTNVRLQYVKDHSKNNDRLSKGICEADRLATNSIQDKSNKHGKNRSMQHYFADDINGKYHFASPRYHGDMTFNDVGLRTDHRWPGSAYDSD